MGEINIEWYYLPVKGSPEWMYSSGSYLSKFDFGMFIKWFFLMRYNGIDVLMPRFNNAFRIIGE